eukprot:CAMPEP_0179144984 /NCGR_PEP_ID=MMETSP0796-20121207/69907_1 /TAXON_ID=73915 /ORGANISM="Pyrodinium bahamense, Strain pbaha01" /LENGTH=68 /DNA_ID=CAMNT_0020845303 /DNA_START=81 /DNA_END=284 /DNA_ORIENTATION=+
MKRRGARHHRVEFIADWDQHRWGGGCRHGDPDNGGGRKPHVSVAGTLAVTMAPLGRAAPLPPLQPRLR